MGERTQFASGRLKVPTLVVLGGRTDRKEYTLSSKLTVIGKSNLATVRLRGWFKPAMAAQMNQRDDGYYLGAGLESSFREWLANPRASAVEGRRSD